MTKKGLIENYKAEIENIEQVIKVIKGKDIKQCNPLELAGFGVYIHNFYNGLENILKRVLLSRRIRIKEGPYWHKELLQRALKEGIIDEELYHKLISYLTFRHYFVHGYAFRLETEKILNLIENIEIVYERFRGQLENVVYNK